MKMFPPHEWRVRLAQRGAGECRECGQRGFTLVELMIALTLSLFLIGAVILTFISGRGASLEAEQLARTQENLRFASDFLARDIRNAGFRDQLTLPFSQYRQIGECFAKLGPGGAACDLFTDNSSLTIRYAGRGACGLAFQPDDKIKLIENTYSLDGDILICEGTERLVDPVDDTVSTEASVVELASGLTGLEFEFLFPTGPDSSETVCNYFDPEDLETACIGVRVEMSFEGQRGQPERSATLTVAFRNVILDKVFVRE